MKPEQIIRAYDSEDIVAYLELRVFKTPHKPQRIVLIPLGAEIKDLTQKGLDELASICYDKEHDMSSGYSYKIIEVK